MEELLQQILSRMEKIEQSQNNMWQAQQAMRQEITDLRDSTFYELHNIKGELSAIRDTQAVAMDKWNKSNDILERVEILLNERESERVAIDATLVDHEQRITSIEQKAG